MSFSVKSSHKFVNEGKNKDSKKTEKDKKGYSLSSIYSKSSKGKSSNKGLSVKTTATSQADFY